MSKDFVIWRYQAADGACVLQDFTGLEDNFRLPIGEPLAAGFPPEVSFHMHPDFPNDLLLTDSLLNSDKCLVVSERLKSALELLKPPKVEYLPVTIIDHKKRKVGQPYYIVHPVDPIDCIDRAKSDVKLARVPAGKIASVKRLLLDEAKVPADRLVFRLKDFWDAVIVRRTLAQALSAGGFSGVRWLEMDQYPEK